MKISQYPAWLLAALGIILPLTGSAQAAPAADGPALYQQHCAKCHGEDGRAGTWRGYLYFARDLSDPVWQARRDDAFILRRINEGPGLMPAYADRLAPAEREALVAVVRGLRAP